MMSRWYSKYVQCHHDVHIYNTSDSTTMGNYVMDVGKGDNAILQNTSFIVEGIETSFVKLDGPQNVVFGLIGTESAVSRFECLEQSEKLGMAKKKLLT